MFEQLSGSCGIAGREMELTALLASLTPGLPAAAQQGVAEQLAGLVQSIASTPALGPADGEARWNAQRQGENFSLFGPDVLISATIGMLGVRGIHVSQEAGADWQFDFAEALSGGASASGASLPPRLRIRAYQDYRLVSDYQFEADLSVTDGRDWRSRFRAGSEETERALRQLPTSEDLENGQIQDHPRPAFADPPRAGGLPGLGLPGAGGGVGAGLGQAMAGMGRVAVGAAIGAAAGLAVAALRRGDDQGTVPPTKTPTEPVQKSGEASPTAPPPDDPSAPSYVDSTVQGPLAPPWRLRATAGPEMGHIFQVKLQSNLGRGNENDIQILDPEISRNHLRFDVRDDALVATDLGSSRGTMIDGQKIDHPTPLRDGQIIEVGRSRFTVEGPVSRQGAVHRAEAIASSKQPVPEQAPEAAIWYYAEKGTQQGPVTESVLRQRLAAGLPPDTLVWNSNLDAWEPAHSIALCPTPAAAPKPAVPQPAADTVEWFFMEKGAQQGPVTEAVLRQRLAAGLPAETMVWNQHLEVWKPARSLGLCTAAPAPAAAPAPKPAPAAHEAPIWYFMDKDARVGPVTERVLRQRLATGLPPETQVWHAKLDNWKPAHAVGLCPAPSPQPAPAPAAPPAQAPVPAAEAPTWYFMDHGVRQGPVVESLLRQRLAHGLPPDTLVWNSKLDNWKPAHTLGLCPSGAAPAAPAPAQGKTCRKCGRVLSAQHRFCAGCGTPV